MPLAAPPGRCSGLLSRMEISVRQQLAVVYPTSPPPIEQELDPITYMLLMNTPARKCGNTLQRAASTLRFLRRPQWQEEGVVYVASKDTYLSAVDARTGQSGGNLREVGGSVRHPSQGAWFTLAGLLLRRLYAIDAQAGRQQWQFDTRDAVTLPLSLWAASCILLIGSTCMQRGERQDRLGHPEHDLFYKALARSVAAAVYRTDLKYNDPRHQQSLYASRIATAEYDVQTRIGINA